MTTLKSTLLLCGIWCISFSVIGQTNNPKKNYYGQGLISRFSAVKHIELKNSEFAEVLNTAELLTKKSNDDFDTKVFFCYNGASDPELEYCNNSINYYISNGKYDLPNEFKLFKVGPFYTVDKASLTPGPNTSTYVLTINHRYDKENVTAQYLITFDKVTLLKKK